MTQWRVLATAALMSALLSVLLGAALSGGLGGESSPMAARALTGRSAVSSRGAPSVLPAGALGPVSAALGKSDPAYRISASGGGFAARNPAQSLQLRFDRSGVRLSSRGLQLGLSLRSAGYGSSLRALGGATPRVSANRVVYARAGLEEWYANGPLGLEQGFTLPRAPSASASATLTLAMTLSGDARASLDGAGQGITLRGAGGASLHYGALVATDAGGHALHGWLALDGRTLLLRVDTRGARYPLRIDPLIQQVAKLTGGPGSEASDFGFSVALSADADTALVGGRESRGTAWVFTRSGSTWEPQGPPLKIEEEHPSEPCDEEAVECGFGRSVALSADGTTALIGAPDDDAGRGAVFVFTRNEAGEWTQQGKRLEVEHEEEAGAGAFGRSVALSADGDTALIGANAARADQGAAWVFTRSGTTWTQQSAKLTDGEEHTGIAYFGRSVALSEDGNTALIGAPAENENLGAAWVFTRSGTTWGQPGVKLTGGEQEGPEGRFGFSVALSAFGNTALVGARGDSGDVGAAWAFTRSGATWEQPGTKLTGGGESGEGEFGFSVALSGDGQVALIGGPRDSDHVGAAWLFTRPGTTWEQQGAKLAGVEGEEARFGAAVALSSNGGNVLVGAPLTEDKSGAAWAFLNSSVPPPTVSSVSPEFGSSAGGTPVRIVGSGFVEGATVAIGDAVASGSVDVRSETELTAVTSAHEAGAVRVAVSDANGESTSPTMYTYVPPPTASSITPEFGSDEGGTLVRITGSGFREGPKETEVKIGDAVAGAVEVVPGSGGKELTAVTTAHPEGSVPVVVKDANGVSTSPTMYTYVAPPTVSSVSPTFGPAAGGALVRIKGSGFREGPKEPEVEIGGAAAGSVAVVAGSEGKELTAVTAEHPEGTVPVVVKDANGESSGTIMYTYASPPTVSSVSPTFGSDAGGTLVRIKGSGFREGPKEPEVEIGGAAAGSVEVVAGSGGKELTAVTAAHADGSVPVVVKDASGESKSTTTYRYVPPPTVSSIAPKSGSEIGGNQVTIRGSGFQTGAGATTVALGGSVASSVDVLSAEELTAVTAAHEAGAVKVVVADANGVSAGGPEYNYELPPFQLFVPIGGGNPNASSGVLSSQVVVPPPVFGVTGNLMPVAGKVLVKFPGSKKFVLLSGITQVPFGTIVNATNGRVTLTTVGPHGAIQTITFYAGEFEITQGRHGVVLARLVGGDFLTCPTARERGHMARTSSKHSSGKHVVRKLWAEGHGSYSTKGSYASGAVLGTSWLTEDLCDGTVIYVATDSVEVTNLVTHHKFLVKAGHRYFAKAP